MTRSRPQSLRDFCRSILLSPDLESKLAAPPAGGFDDSKPGPALRLSRPARAPELTLYGGAPKLPRPAALRDPKARALCLARFAHHELMAVELFAWSLLRWPDLDGALRAALAGILADEQRHCRAYLGRLEALGERIEDHPHSDYFWKHVPAIEAAPDGPLAFLCAVGLTLEQANLDFSALYRDAFRAAGDPDSARVCEDVQRDEIRHVRVAATWIRRLAPGADDSQIYAQHVPFPLGATRARGRHFDAGARRQAGLSEHFIDAVRQARRNRPG